MGGVGRLCTGDSYSSTCFVGANQIRLIQYLSCSPDLKSLEWNYPPSYLIKLSIMLNNFYNDTEILFSISVLGISSLFTQHIQTFEYLKFILSMRANPDNCL